MSYLVSIGTALPEYRTPQMEIFSFMNGVYTGTEEERRRLRMLYEKSGIRYRHSAVPDFQPALNTRQFFPATKNLEPFPSLEQRMLRFHEIAPGLAATSIRNCLEHTSTSSADLTHLISVSCTGLAAPGLDLMLMEKLGLARNIQRTSINFMGCYAAVHAMKMADLICRHQPDAKVIIVCTELCTLHFQKKQDHDNLVANAIFSDGAAAALVTGKAGATHQSSPRYSFKGFYSEVHHDGKNDMAWQLSSTGFLMTLSSYIPQLIEKGIDTLLLSALKEFGIDRSAITNWAIHPGGRKILEVIEKQLALDKDALKHSYEVLSDYGNMSSATILFVLKRMMEAENAQGHVFGAAFGPGLTMETFLLTED